VYAQGYPQQLWTTVEGLLRRAAKKFARANFYYAVAENALRG